MKKSDIPGLLRHFAMPVLLILLGLILLVNPDSAAVAIATVMAWILLCSGAAYGIWGLLSHSSRRIGHFITAACCLVMGGTLLINPLFLARNIGRVLGLILAVEGIQNLVKHSVSKTMAVLTLLGALILLMAPMTASRLVFFLCGLILLVIGGAQFWERIRRRRLDQSNEDPNIIDAL